MKIKNKITMALFSILLLASAAQAFDIKLSYSKLSEINYTDYYNGVDHKPMHNYYAQETDNIGLEVSHYKNRDKQGFGFGWRVAGTVPTSYEFDDGGTIEVGIAPGYSLMEELALKIELGFGIRKSFTTNYDSYDSSIEKIYSDDMAGIYYGLSLEYIVIEHIFLGVAVRNWVYATDQESLIPEASIGYRF